MSQYRIAHYDNRRHSMLFPADGGEAIAEFFPHHEQEEQEILRACNSHADLIAALEEMLRIFGGDFGNDSMTRQRIDGIRAARAALAKAVQP